MSVEYLRIDAIAAQSENFQCHVAGLSEMFRVNYCLSVSACKPAPCCGQRNPVDTWKDVKTDFIEALRSLMGGFT